TTLAARLQHLRRLVTGLPALRAINPRRAERNVAHHYDLDGRLYRLFLDPDMQYSCAYFERPDLSLDAAQLAKKRLIAAKLLVRPGAR
ncbi:MAG: class I SAM-dependent methyltransferase, partial [Rhodobacteraceae bacterium]|nr:class I SAM-dependent methyltransferase [Paracoccaceae bacterium]